MLAAHRRWVLLTATLWLAGLLFLVALVAAGALTALDACDLTVLIPVLCVVPVFLHLRAVGVRAAFGRAIAPVLIGLTAAFGIASWVTEFSHPAVGYTFPVLAAASTLAGLVRLSGRRFTALAAAGSMLAAGIAASAPYADDYRQHRELDEAAAHDAHHILTGNVPVYSTVAVHAEKDLGIVVWMDGVGGRSGAVSTTAPDSTVQVTTTRMPHPKVCMPGTATTPGPVWGGAEAGAPARVANYLLRTECLRLSDTATLEVTTLGDLEPTGDTALAGAPVLRVNYPDADVTVEGLLLEADHPTVTQAVAVAGKVLTKLHPVNRERLDEGKLADALRAFGR